MTHEEINQLYRRNHEAMYRLARTMLYDEEESRDVVSEVFERVSKDFCRRRLNVMLTGKDLFNGAINRFTLYSNRFMIYKQEDNDSRCVQLSLRYPFTPCAS